MITLLFFLFYLTAANKLEPLLYQNESDFFVADFGRSLTVSGDNRDKIAQMLYFGLQGHDSDLPFYSDVLQYGCWCQLIGDKWSISNKGTPVDDIDVKCVPAGLCKNQRGTAPIPVEENDNKVMFAPFNDFLEDPALQFGPVEIGGNIVAYCKGVGD